MVVRVDINDFHIGEFGTQVNFEASFSVNILFSMANFS